MLCKLSTMYLSRAAEATEDVTFLGMHRKATYVTGVIPAHTMDILFRILCGATCDFLVMWIETHGTHVTTHSSYFSSCRVAM